MNWRLKMANMENLNNNLLDAWIERETGTKNGTPEHTAAKAAVTKLIEDAESFIKAEKKEAAIENMNYSPMSIFGNAVNWTFGAVVEPLTGVEPDEFDEF